MRPSRGERHCVGGARGSGSGLAGRGSFGGYHALVELDKADIAYATPLAIYAVAQIRGRPAGSMLNESSISAKTGKAPLRTITS